MDRLSSKRLSGAETNRAPKSAIKEIFDLILSKAEITASSTAADDGRDFWPSDALHATEYFRNDAWAAEIVSKYFQQLRGAGKEITYFDLCGRASFGDKVDKNFNFSLDGRGRSAPKTNYMVGDITNSSDFDRSINDLKAQGVQLNLVTFKPVAGLESYSIDSLSSEYRDSKDLEGIFFRMIYRRMRKLLEIVPVGGMLFMELPSYMSIFSKSPYYKAITKDLGMEEVESGQPYTRAQLYRKVK